jgi:hypothetical protein
LKLRANWLFEGFVEGARHARGGVLGVSVGDVVVVVSAVSKPRTS